MQSGSEIWTEIHDEVQRILESLDEVVRSRVPGLKVASWRTQGRSFYLFSHRTFSRTDEADVDPVVVGMTFSPVEDEHRSKVLIDADISGESTGATIESVALRVVLATREESLSAAHELAHILADRSRAIADALLAV